MAITIVSGNDDDAIRFPQMTKIFRNSRGLKWYYALITTSSGIRLYKSEYGTSWSLVSTLNSEHEFIGSFDLYDDGSQLIVYVAYGQSTAWVWSDPIHYRRMTIADDASDPSIGSEQTAVASTLQGQPVIRRDRNGYVHIVFARNRDYVEKGSTYMKAEPWIIGTTTTNPGDSPSWCTPIKIEAHPDLEVQARHARISLVIFGSGDIGGAVYPMHYSTTEARLKGKDIQSYNGSSYILGTAQWIDEVPDETEEFLPLDEGFKVLVDTSGYTHLIYRNPTAYERTRHRKSSSTNTVESWGSANIVDDSGYPAYSNGLVIALDESSSPDTLYAFYVFHAIETNLLRWRSTLVDTISWGSETTIQDDSDRLVDIGAYFTDIEKALLIIYRYYNSPYESRFFEFPLDQEEEVLGSKNCSCQVTIRNSDFRNLSAEMEIGISLISGIIGDGVIGGSGSARPIISEKIIAPG